MDDTAKRPLFTSSATTGLACLFLFISVCSIQLSQADNVVTFQQSVSDAQNKVSSHHISRKRRDVTDLESEADHPEKCEAQKEHFQSLRSKLQAGEKLETTVSFLYM